MELKYHIWSPSVSSIHGESFKFSGANGSVSWPKRSGMFLGKAGVFNFLFRQGFNANLITTETVSSISKIDLLFVVLDSPLTDEIAITKLKDLILSGYKVVGSGSPEVWVSAMPELFSGSSAACENPYAGLAYGFSDASPEIVAPSRWDFFCFDRTPDMDVHQEGNILSIQGERQTPSRALLLEQKNAPALIRYRNFIYLNGSPFHAFQAWLQGQEDLAPWLNWRNRLFWLDEQVASLRNLLVKYGLLPKQTQPLLAPDLGETCVVLRHDLDYSKDVSYLNAEDRGNIPGVHAILRDADTKFWTTTLKQYPKHESAFHYNTAHYSRPYNWLLRKMGKPQSSYKPNKKEVVGKGLYKQVQWAKKNAIGISTLHRHLSFTIYPEYIDALDYVFEKEPDVMGASSMFRSQVLRWGIDRVNGGNGTYADFPDAQFPYWFPFKLAHAGYGGKLLKGWESASIMEAEPELIGQMLDYKIAGLPQMCFTFNFHPAHANLSTFYKDGSLDSYEKVLSIISESEVSVITLKNIYKELNSLSL